MSQNAQSIQTLLDAEKEAAKIVARARQYRVQRLKDARTEAAKDVEALRAQRHAEYTAAEDRHRATAGDTSAIDAQTQNDIAALQKQLTNTRKAALDRVLNAVSSVRAEPHRNALLHLQRAEPPR